MGPCGNIPSAPTMRSRFVRYCMSRIGLLKDAGVIPVVVFDGILVPAKADTAASRRV